MQSDPQVLCLRVYFLFLYRFAQDKVLSQATVGNAASAFHCKIICNLYGMPRASAPTGFNQYLKRAVVGVDNLGDPIRFEAFSFGLPRASAPTAEDEKLH